MSQAPRDGSVRDTLRRWLHENVADTRQAGGPEPRIYEVAFARVWDELLDLIGRRRGWTLVHKDEELGLISIACTMLVSRFMDDVTIWVALDANGLTRVDALSRARLGRGDLGVNRRRIVRLLRALDTALGPSARLIDTRPNTSAADLGGRAPRDRATLA